MGIGDFCIIEFLPFAESINGLFASIIPSFAAVKLIDLPCGELPVRDKCGCQQILYGFETKKVTASQCITGNADKLIIIVAFPNFEVDGADNASPKPRFAAKPGEEFPDERMLLAQVRFHFKTPRAEAFKDFDVNADILFVITKQRDKNIDWR
jgi:hypothetical protein